MIELVEQAKNGEKNAFSEIYSRFKNQVYYFCLKIVIEPAQAKQLSFDTFECAFERLDTLESPDQFEIWLKNIAAIKCFNYIHKMKPMLFLQAPEEGGKILFEESEIEAMDKEVVLDETKSAALMDMMFSRLDDAQRMTLMLHYYVGLSVSRIAKIMTCTQEMVVGRMESAASSMKATLRRLAMHEIKPASVDFRTVLMLSAACINVPSDLEKMVDGYVSEHYGEPEPIPEEKTYSFENYVSSLDNKEPGELESATVKYSSEKIQEFEIKAPSDEKIQEFEIKASQGERESGSFKKAQPKENVLIALKKKFRSLSMTQQSVAVLAFVGILAIIILAFALPNSKEDPKASSKKTESQVKKPVASQVAPEPEKPKITLTVNNNAPESFSVLLYDEVEAGKENPAVNKATYALPTVSIPDNEMAQTKINNFFIGEKDAILATYTDDFNIQNSRYGYNNVSGWYSTTAVRASSDAGASRIDEAVISIEMTKEVKNYGYEDVLQVLCYNFSTRTGERLGIDDVMEDYDGYINYATNKIVSIVETKADKGDFTLNDGHYSIVKAAVEDDEGWYFTENGINIIFQDGTLVNPGYGALKVELTYSEIGAFLKGEYNPEGNPEDYETPATPEISSTTNTTAQNYQTQSSSDDNNAYGDYYAPDDSYYPPEGAMIDER